MPLYQLGLLLVLLPVCSFAPGFFFVRKLRWNPLEKLCASIGLSLLLVFLAAWGIYCAGPHGNHMPANPMPCAIVSVVCAVMGAACWKDMGRLLRVPIVRRVLAGYGFLLLWTALLLGIIRNYSGALWFGDWLEHFQRTLFFLYHFPTDTPIAPIYVIPYRPPMMNVLAAFFLSQTADRFEFYQIVFFVLNVLLFLPCCLIMPALGRRARRRIPLLVLFFAASPLVMQNTTYAWTKALAAFYIVMAIWFYLAGWRRRDTVRTVAAFAALAAGLLVHYSAGPYVAILTLHYLFRVFPHRPHRWRELATITVICGLLFGVWLFWSLAIYGPHLTFASNSSVVSSQQYEGNTLVKIALNVFDSLVPPALHNGALYVRFGGQRTSGYLRDFFFATYEHGAITGMGLIAGPVIVWLAIRALRRRRDVPAAKTRKPVKRQTVANARLLPLTPEQSFWRILIIAGFLLGIAVVGERDPLGVAHLTMLSLQVIGITMLAAILPWNRRALAVVILAGCALDFAVGILLQAHVESFENTASVTVFPNMEFTGNSIQTEQPGPDALSLSAWNNWFQKHQLSEYPLWLRHLDARYSTLPNYRAILPSYQAAVEQARLDDQRYWQGWFTTHGGETVFLGDHVAGWFSGATVAAETLLVLTFAGLAAFVWRAVRG